MAGDAVVPEQHGPTVRGGVASRLGMLNGDVGGRG